MIQVNVKNATYIARIVWLTTLETWKKTLEESSAASSAPQRETATISVEMCVNK